ncbi:hypothetical protein HBHAL_2604 [Halobacillus halophilus DSM 2266]|uniref:Uncharacterized protein n=1 Tax=Halobacillus halophilus (strain ATCC 35676 / DSM 2266 / JCM 20832 / KCTC 3685 / LMG 17431 / NBRC 102448 / NCIMB 2269) TaxID=866895 RepID=I0JLD0_HALH3|nr:hypothetical protein [Halobacillus halophilus]CCG44950.1 hypothetical protein HBHAL_2604 [Halobacillus halophilus DSM 2266]
MENLYLSETTILYDKKKLQLKYVPNEGFNFFSAQIVEQTQSMPEKVSSLSDAQSK